MQIGRKQAMKYLCVAMLSIFLSACANNITYFQSQRTSFTVETSAKDPTKPVQGNLGYRARTFIVNPKMSETGDVMSLIGDAQFALDGDNLPDRLVFKTALITGDAAADLSEDEVADAAAALAGVNTIPSDEDLTLGAFNKICENDKYNEAAAFSGVTFSNLDTADKNMLGNITGVGGFYNANRHTKLMTLFQAGKVCNG